MSSASVSSTPPLPGAPPVRRLKVLVVDDSVALADVICKWLRAAGHEVHPVFSGDDAALTMRDLRPDAVVTDIFMSAGNGMDVIAQARGLVPRPRIVAISGGSPMMASGDCLELARQAGADACLRKPFNPRELLELIENPPRS